MTAIMHFDTHAFARESTPKDLVTNASLDTRLTLLEQRMTLKLGGLIVAGIAFISALARFFPAAGG